MFSLIITIISIALVAALALATLYYGGSAFGSGAARAQASKLVLQGQQLLGASDLYFVDHRAWPAAIQDLVTGGYLKQIPTAQASGLNEAVAAGRDWSMVPNAPTFLLATDAKDVCAEVNLAASLRKKAILKQAYSGLVAQCYGASATTLTTVFRKDMTTPFNDVAGNGLPVPDVAVAAAPPTDPTDPGWLVAPGAAVATSTPASPGLPAYTGPTGPGTVGTLTVDPQFVDFGTVDFDSGIKVTPYMLMVANNGVLPITVSNAFVDNAITANWGAPGQPGVLVGQLSVLSPDETFSLNYTAGDTSCTNGTATGVPAASTCFVNLYMMTTKLGTFQWPVTLVTSEGNVTVTLRGTVAVPPPSMTVTGNAPYADTIVGKTTVGSWTIKNTSTSGNIVFPSNPTSTNFTNFASGSTLLGQCGNYFMGAGFFLAPGQTCTMNPSFSPKTAGALTNTVTIDYLFKGVPATVTVTETGKGIPKPPPTPLPDLKTTVTIQLDPSLGYEFNTTFWGPDTPQLTDVQTGYYNIDNGSGTVFNNWNGQRLNSGQTTFIGGTVGDTASFTSPFQLSFYGFQPNSDTRAFIVTLPLSGLLNPSAGAWCVNWKWSATNYPAIPPNGTLDSGYIGTATPGACPGLAAVGLQGDSAAAWQLSVGSTATRTVSFQNIGSAPLLGGTATVNNGNYTVNGMCSTLAAGASCTLPVTWSAPNTPGASDNATLTVAYSGASRTVALSAFVSANLPPPTIGGGALAPVEYIVDAGPNPFEVEVLTPWSASCGIGGGGASVYNACAAAATTTGGGYVACNVVNTEPSWAFPGNFQSRISCLK